MSFEADDDVVRQWRKAAVGFLGACGVKLFEQVGGPRATYAIADIDAMCAISHNVAQSSNAFAQSLRQTKEAVKKSLIQHVMQPRTGRGLRPALSDVKSRRRRRGKPCCSANVGSFQFATFGKKGAKRGAI